MSFPYSHYWTADDGRVFSSATQTVIDAGDPAYVAWSAGNSPTPWPRDGAGNQTNAALQDVLTPYNLFVDLSFYCINARWLKEQGGITLTSGMPIKTDDRAQAKINGAMLASKYPPAPAKAAPGGGGPAFTTKWHAADGTFWPLDTPAIIAMSGELQLHIDQCFEASAGVQDGIAAGIITTRDQVDQAFNW